MLNNYCFLIIVCVCINCEEYDMMISVIVGRIRVGNLYFFEIFVLKLFFI